MEQEEAPLLVKILECFPISRKLYNRDTMPQIQDIGSSETTRADFSEEISNINTRARNAHKSQKFFSHWLAGVIDGDGSLLISKAGYTSCEITVDEKERQVLNLIKSHLGGKITRRTGVSALRWRLHNKKGMHILLERIQGKILTPERYQQLARVSDALNVECAPLGQFSKDNAWLAGFYEAEGYFRVNSSTIQCSVTLSQKNSYILRQIQKQMPGRIYWDRSWQGHLYAASSVEDIKNWVRYFSQFPLCSWKQYQLTRFKKVLLYKGRRIHLTRVRAPWKRLQRLLHEFHSSHSE